MTHRSDKHGRLHDESLAEETRGLEQAGRSTRAQEGRGGQAPEADEPSGDRRIVPDDRRGVPDGMTPSDVDERSEIARHLGRTFPARRDELLRIAEENHAPDAVLAALRRLPADRDLTGMQDVARELGMGTESHRS